jgi:hypothetical protein
MWLAEKRLVYRNASSSAACGMPVGSLSRGGLCICASLLAGKMFI